MMSTNAPLTDTLFIPLMARALEGRRRNPLIRDEKAVDILTKMEAGNRLTDGGPISAHGILARTWVIDGEIRKLLSAAPNLTLINLGAGLDTRFSRLDNGHMRCFELDLPEVIDLRRRYFQEDERVRFIGKSVLDETWIQECAEVEAATERAIIAEGLLMYFDQEAVRRILSLLAVSFPGAHMYFDTVHNYFVGKGISAAFRWGLDDAGEIEALCPSLHLVQGWSTGDLLKSRQSILLRAINILPATRNRSRILHVRF